MKSSNGKSKFVVAVVIILVLLYALSDPYGLKDTDFIGNVKENSDRMLEEAGTEYEPYEENNVEEEEEVVEDEETTEVEEEQDEEESGNGFKVEKVAITEGSIYKLELKYMEQEIEWTSENEEVAGVNSSGTVVAKSPGNANITATVSGETFSCEVLVAPKLQKKDFKIYNKSESNSVKNYSDGRGCLYNEFTIESGNFLDGEQFTGSYQHDYYCRTYEKYDEDLKEENRGIQVGVSEINDVMAAYGVRYSADGLMEGVQWDDDDENTEYITYDFVYDNTYYYKRFYFNEDGTVELIKWFTGHNGEEWS